ncbi:lipocalin-like domain-containing protein [Chitinophaga agrisoli]|uniref:Lipocalin-like domain-containing protein n=1 Tax=Chitinophaga agrisoli TaxID=2607653 RepID=A0A5B2VL12_9BACT|nr:lipocalin-like domain-containing protein [Chitinophaga agrisoli]KAA2240263.1 lipocalin-like domain-containing protein [Chitinophaga agrisoli]
MNKILYYIITTLCTFIASPVLAQQLVGAWKLTAADKILPNGQRVADYGANPHGIAIFTPDGHYMVEIYSSDRKPFASGDRKKGTPEEYRDAMLTMSCHFGTYEVDTVRNRIRFHIDRSSYPNSDATTRENDFSIKDSQLSWQVPPRPNGDIPVSVFTRIR